MGSSSSGQCHLTQYLLASMLRRMDARPTRSSRNSPTRGFLESSAAYHPATGSGKEDDQAKPLLAVLRIEGK